MKNYTLVLGNCEIKDCEAALVVTGSQKKKLEVFRLREREEDGTLIVDFDVRDKDGKLLTKVFKNHVTHAEPGYRFTNSQGCAEVVEEATGKPIVRVEALSLRVVRVTGVFCFDGVFFHLSEDDGIRFPNGNILDRCVIENCGAAIVLSHGQILVGASS